jgi:hypothetical protein
MAKRDYFLIVDTETTMNDRVVDFGAVICDRKGQIYAQCGVLIAGIFGEEALFYKTQDEPSQLWSKQGADRRFDHYLRMVAEGSRMVASVAAVNRWLERARGEFNPILTAYNLAFDIDKCGNTGIDLSIFSLRFCLWHAAASRWQHTKRYRQFVLDNHVFNPVTDKGNMSFRTNAETMCRFVHSNPGIPNEPHTALEDAIDYELPILVKLVNSTKRKDWLYPKAANWQHVQVRDWFKPK